uniref:Protein kinase domain-containing protein n=1 Tax=viral metagenome TaxID=1070528 RepID=A0A6C0KP77_9ZZZZ
MSALNEEWRDSPWAWASFPLTILPKCNIKGEVYDTSGVFLCKYSPIKSLGNGTFGHVDAFKRLDAQNKSTVVAIKRPKFSEMKLLTEALFQWKLHYDLMAYALEFCVPKVYDIFLHQQSDDVWFSMEAFEPQLLSQWCGKHIHNTRLFVLFLLQIALILEVFEELKFDHRDLKINNMLIVEETIRIKIFWNQEDKTLEFPFRIIFVDFGFACRNATMDVKYSDPYLDACPKEGRNIFQILVSLWNSEMIRDNLDPTWCAWIRKCISTIWPSNYPALRLTESTRDLGWMYTLTDDKEFRAPLCSPRKMIRECMAALDRIGGRNKN